MMIVHIIVQYITRTIESLEKQGYAQYATVQVELGHQSGQDLTDIIATGSDTAIHVDVLEEYMQTEFIEGIYIN